MDKDRSVFVPDSQQVSAKDLMSSSHLDERLVTYRC